MFLVFYVFRGKRIIIWLWQKKVFHTGEVYNWSLTTQLQFEKCKSWPIANSFFKLYTHATNALYEHWFQKSIYWPITDSFSNWTHTPPMHFPTKDFNFLRVVLSTKNQIDGAMQGILSVSPSYFKISSPRLAKPQDYVLRYLMCFDICTNGFLMLTCGHKESRLHVAYLKCTLSLLVAGTFVYTPVIQSLSLTKTLIWWSPHWVLFLCISEVQSLGSVFIFFSVELGLILDFSVFISRSLFFGYAQEYNKETCMNVSILRLLFCFCKYLWMKVGGKQQAGIAFRH